MKIDKEISRNNIRTKENFHETISNGAELSLLKKLQVNSLGSSFCIYSSSHRPLTSFIIQYLYVISWEPKYQSGRTHRKTPAMNKLLSRISLSNVSQAKFVSLLSLTK